MTALDPSIQVATQGIFGIGLQAARGVPRTKNAAFNYFPMTGNGFGFNQGTAALPPESGKSITTRGMYKTGIASEGQVSMIPRLEGNFGNLLLMLLGKDTVTTGTDLAAASVTGVNVHSFGFDTAETTLPYATVRRVLPGPRSLGELTQDCRMGNAEINIPAVGPITWSCGMAGRVPNGSNMFVNDPDKSTNWNTGAITYEGDDSFANAVDPNSTVTIMGIAQRCTGLSISVQNELTPGDQTRIVGAQTPYDYVVLGRQISIRATVLFTDKALYQSLLSGVTPDATTWSSTPLGGDIDFKIFSPNAITGASVATNHAIQFRTTQGNIKWGVEGVMPLNPRQLMTLNLVGTFVRQASGSFFDVRVQNGVALAYTQYKVAPVTTVTSITNTTGACTIVGTGLGSFAAGDLVVVTGAANAANNGVFTVATTGSSATVIAVTETTMVAETVSPAGSVSVCA